MSIENARLATRAAADGDLQLLQWMHSAGECDLGALSEVGTSPAYLAVLHDRPAVIWLLHSCGVDLTQPSDDMHTQTLSCGVDLTQPCDDIHYGSAAFWAAKYGRDQILLELFNLNVDLRQPCERHGKDPYFIAGVCGNQSAIERVEHLKRIRNRAATRITSLVRGYLSRAAAAKIKIRHLAAVSIQAVMRGEVRRIRRGRGRWKALPMGQRIVRRRKASVKIQAVIRGGVVRLKQR